MCLVCQEGCVGIFKQHLSDGRRMLGGKLKVKSEEKMLDFLVDTPLLSVLALA